MMSTRIANVAFHVSDLITCTPTSSNNFQEREVPAGFADEVIYSLFDKQSEDLDLLYEDLEQIDDIDIEEMDINWQIAMIAIRMKKFYKKTRRRVRIDGTYLNAIPKGIKLMERRENPFIHDQEHRKKKQNSELFVTVWIDGCCLIWGETYSRGEETNHALMGNQLQNIELDVQQEAIKIAYSLPVKKLEDQIGPQKPEISDSNDNSTEHSTCQSNNGEGSFGNPSEHSFESESESISVPKEMYVSKSVITNERVVSESKD
ncbi:hypothetical protein Tco_0727353 [Tanacetum coccineum]|uniref:Uncharacterized protein n=1 Tax=Tanacetum coccineum TaxID=301880 RepID=A0ABQ4YKN9_9ASTR